MANLIDDGTLDTVFECGLCHEEIRYNFEPVDGETYESFLEWCVEDFEQTHSCNDEEG